MHQHTVEVGNVLIVDNKTPVRLKKAVGRQQLQPVWHGMDGFKVLRCGVDDHFFPLCLHHNDRRDRKNVYALPGLNRHLHQSGMIQIQSVLQIPEQTLPVYGLGQITEYMEPHGFIQIFGIRSNNKNDNIFIFLFQFVSYIDSVKPRHLDIEKKDILVSQIRKQGLPV